MAQLGQSVEASLIPDTTLGELADRYGEWMVRQRKSDLMRPATVEYYKQHIQRFLDARGDGRAAHRIRPYELEMFQTGWHSVQAVQRLYNWGVNMGLVDQNPVARVKKPTLGQRERILSRHEVVRMLRASDKNFRSFLLALQQQLARPQEIRAVR